MIIDNVHSMGRLFGGFVHALILILQRKAAGAASPTHQKRVVSAAQLL
jgi:hypothetical protein